MNNFLTLKYRTIGLDFGFNVDNEAWFNNLVAGCHDRWGFG